MEGMVVIDLYLLRINDRDDAVVIWRQYILSALQCVTKFVSSYSKICIILKLGSLSHLMPLTAERDLPSSDFDLRLKPGAPFEFMRLPVQSFAPSSH